MPVTDKLDLWWAASSATQKLNAVKAAGQNARSGVAEYLAACAGWTPAEVAVIDPEIVAAANGLKTKMQALADALTADEIAFLGWRPGS